MANEWLDQKHKVFETNEEAWRREERRLRGGDDVLQELRPFLWETMPGDRLEMTDDEHGTRPSGITRRENPGDHYKARQAEATYLNFPGAFAEIMTGHLMENAPTPGSGLEFGSMGDIREDPSGQPTMAELVYRNVDGVGIDASQWMNWWTDVYTRALATGHRWVFVDAPRQAPQNDADRIAGLRPYLTEYSPLAVPLWHFEKGELQFAVARVWQPDVRLKGDRLEGLDPTKRSYLLLVREGFDGLGSDFSGGGWWMFNPEKERMEDMEGDWQATGGRIPLFPLYHQRDSGGDERPAISRGALMELGQLAVSYMNLTSAADYDAWDAAGSIQYIIGADPEAFNIVADKLAEGSKVIPVPGRRDGETPEIYDSSSGAVASEVFRNRLDAKRQDGVDLAALGPTSDPNASGISKRAGFAEMKSPRLANMASEIEAAQHMAVRFLEQRMRLGTTPEGAVQWPREFDLLDVTDVVERMFRLEKLSGIRSPSVAAELLMTALRDSPLSTNGELMEKAAEEYLASAERSAERQERMTSLQEEMEEAANL